MMSSNPFSRTPEQRRGSRLSTLLLISVVLLAIIPAATLTALSSQSEARFARAGATEILAAHADSAVFDLNNWAEFSKRALSTAADDPVIRQLVVNLVDPAMTEGSVRGIADASFEQYALNLLSTTDFQYVLLVDSNGISSASSDRQNLNEDFSGETWFKQAVRSPGSVILIGPGMFQPSTNQEALYFATAVSDPDTGAVIGVMMARTSTAPIQEILTQALPQIVFGDTGDYFLVRDGQRYVTPPRFPSGSEIATDEIIPAALNKENGRGVWVDYRGNTVLGVYRWVNGLNISLILKEDESQALAGVNQRILFSIAIGTIIALVALVGGVFLARRVTGPLNELSETAARLSRGDLTIKAPETPLLEFQQVASSLNHMTEQLKELIATQEDTIRARTQQLQITAQIGRAIAAETDLERLLSVATSRIRDQLNHYHAQVFLLDDLRQYAVLRASTGEAGQALLDRGHKLPVGSRSVIGQVTQSGEPVLASDTHHADYWMPNPLLPATRAELAVPIRVGDQIIGALDVQSMQPDAFDEETIAALQTIADQLAVALRNAQLFEEKEGLISASVQLTQMLTRDSWDTFLSQRQSPSDVGFRYDLSDVEPLNEKGNGHTKSLAPGGDQHSHQEVTVPISLRGEVIGELEAEIAEGETFSEDERQLVGQVLDRVALALENARLFEQTQVSLQEANRLYQASQRISSSDTIPHLAQELAELAGIENASRVAVVLLDDIEVPPGDRWVEMAGFWALSETDAFKEFPKRLRTGQSPLLGIEGTPVDGRIIQDVSTDPDLSAASRENLQQLGVRSAATFPLAAGRRTVGWLIIHSLDLPNAFSESLARYYRTVADQAGTALEGLRLLNQTEIRARRLQATNEVSRAASSILNPEILLPMVVDKISEAFNYYHVQIFVIDEQAEVALLRASTGEIGQQLLSGEHKLPVGSQSVIGQATASGDAVIVRDIETDPIHRPNELLPDTRSEMAIPLKTGDRVIGALDVQSNTVNAFDAEAQAILQSLAGELAVTMENAQLFQEIQERVAELTTINLVSQSISRAETREDVYEVVGTQLQRTFGARNGFLALLDEETNMIHLPLFLEGGELQEGIPPQPMGTGITSHVIKTRQTVLINENLEEEAARLGTNIIGGVTRSMLAVPLLLGEEVVGVISIQDQDYENAYTDAHVRQLTTMAAYLAIKLRNAELLDEAEQRAGELGFLFNVTRAAVATSDLDSALSNVAEILTDEIEGADSAIIYLASQNGEQLEPHAAVGYGRDTAARGPVNWGDGLIGYAATHAEPLIVVDTQEDDRFVSSADDRTRSAVLVPLMTASALIGILVVESTQQGEFGQADLRLLETASSTLTAIIQNAQLLEQISVANEQLQELDRLKTQFLANMSHELRTPLNSIIGFSRVMLKGIDGELNEMQSQDLNTIYNSGQHLLGLINDILDLSKIEAKMMEIQPEYTDMDEIVEGVLSTAKGLVKDRPVELYREIEAGLPQVWGDPQRIRQVLLNLVSNAAKFTREGSITVRVARKEMNPETGEVPRIQIDVADTGIGIPGSNLGAIFEAFQQVDGTTTRQYEGTGLGLPISRNFVELHGGRMWVESEVGKGSVFSFTIPLHPAVVENDAPVDRLEGDTRPLVLAIDDEQGVIDLYSRYLEKEGYAVIGLGHANDVVQRAIELRPHVVILDLNLPGKDGWLAINDLKQNTQTQNIPVIVCSIEEDRERAASAGVLESLVKPVMEEDLLKAIRLVTNGSAPADKSIVVIDAYADHAAYVRDALASTGLYKIRSASTGYEGLIVVQESPPDAVVIDFDLADMDGYGLVMSLRSHEDTKNLPVVILTARDVSSEDIAKLGSTESVQFLSKHDYDAYRVIDAVSSVIVGTGKLA